jgi:F-type H+-transporting ATPase subunit epsilon
MELKVLLPFEEILRVDVVKVHAESQSGSFALLPHHADLVSTLVPGILSYQDLDGQEGFVALDEGLLVKRGGQVTVTVRRGVAGGSLETLQETVVEQFLALDEREEQARAVLARLEASFVYGLVGLGDQG